MLHRGRNLELLVLAIACISASGYSAEKPVHLAWFPRFSPDSKRLISAHGNWEANEGGEICVWDIEKGEPVFVLPAPRGVRTVAWSAKGKFFVAGDYGSEVRFFDAASGKQTDLMKLSANVEVVLITPDESQLVTALGNGSVSIWDLPSKQERHTWRRIHRGGIWGMALSANGKAAATAGQDHVVRVLDLTNNRIVHQLLHPAEANGVVFTNDGKFLLTGCGDSLIRVFDVESGKELRQLKGHASGSVTDLQFSLDGKLLASSGMDGTVRVWDMATFDNPTLQKRLSAHNGFAFGVAISPNYQWLASAGWDNQIKLWDLKTFQERWSKKR